MPTDPNQRATTVKKPGHYKNQCRLLKKQREQTEDVQNNPGNKNIGANTSNSSSNLNNNNDNKNNSRATRKPKTVYPPCETCGKTNHSTDKCYFGANAANRPPPGTEYRKYQIRSQKEPIKVPPMKFLKLQPKIQTKNATSSLRSCD